MSYRVAIDTGGTFTDIVAIDESTGALAVTKTPSTPHDPSVALVEGVRKVARVGGFPVEDVAVVAHGTTTATNAVLQRHFHRIGLLVTGGFRHVLEIARQSVPDGYGNSYFWVKPERIVPLERVREVGGRVAFDGSELAPLVEEDVVAAAEGFRRHGADCIAVCFLHSYANGEHERRAAEILRRELPDAFVSISSEVLPEYREYERAMTTILDAFVKPYTRDYVLRAEAAVHGLVTKAVPFLIMQSNGGVISAAEVANKPITTILSGPAAGVLAASFIGERAGYRNLLTLDAGGTSTDVCLIEELEPHITTESRIDGHPVKTPMVDIVTVAAGGGSIAWISQQGSLKVGPNSAGASPGPICYGQGGTEPTTTDANLVLGRVPPALLGGEVPLDVDAARAAFERLGAELDLPVEEAAAGVLEIAAWNQTHGIRQVTIERGRDPRGFCLVAFGGSGPLLSAHVADLLEIETVLVPPNPGNVSAFGLLVSDIKRDLVRTFVRGEHELDAAELEAAWSALEAEGRDVLLREGVAEDRIQLRRVVDARYLGEAHEVKVPVGAGPLDEPRLAELCDRFHDVHDQVYGFAYRGHQPVELVNLRVQAVGVVHRPTIAPGGTEGGDATPVAMRPVYFDGPGWSDCPVYRRDALGAGATLSGPAIVEEFGSTTVVFPGWSVRVDDFANLIMERSR
ncbi:MAG: hydantoinase/oxoprolinase family protein [Thermoleophilia bacterium]